MCGTFSSNFTFQYYAEVKVDGVVKERVENPKPQQFTDVKVWMSTQFGHPPANVYIRNFYY